MNDEPAQDAPQDAPQDAAQDASTDAIADPLDDTQRVDVPRYSPAPDPRPDTRWAWAPPASPTGQPTSDRWYEPVPAGSPPAYATPGWGAPATGPAAPPATGYTQPPIASGGRRQGGAGVGTVLVASVLSAVLASGSTVLVLERTGAFDRPAPTSTTGTAQPVAGQQPVTIDESSAVIDAAERVGPAVVKIMTQGEGTGPIAQIPSSGVGSGFIYDADGWILTNRHVVADADTLTVELRDGRQFEGTVYGVDTLTDLAVIKIDQTGLPVAPLGKSDGLKIGQLVVAIGSPLGTYSFSVTSGIVSGTGRDIAVDNGTRISNLIQTDAAINPGNSGGPLADASGSVVGINTAVATDSSGIGFAIPIDIAKPIMAQAVAGEALSRPWIGIRFRSITLQVKKELNLAVDAGALVTNTGGNGPAVVDNSPAAAAGLLDGDIIVSISGIRIDREHPLDAILTQFKPNDTVTLVVLRDGEQVTLDVTLGTRPSNL
jgi:2-alkenal reductase